MSAKTLRRYTQVAPLIHLLNRKAITLLSPSRWDDKNDAYYLEVYRRRQSLASVLALCLAESPETYHHWQVFAGPSGVCLEFVKSILIESVCGTAGVQCGKVRYPLLKTMRKTAPATRELPYIKRYPYKDEREFRIIFEDRTNMLQAKDVPFDPQALRKVIVNPWMPPPVYASVKETLAQFQGWSHVQIETTTIINNDEWMRFAGGAMQDESALTGQRSKQAAPLISSRSRQSRSDRVVSGDRTRVSRISTCMNLRDHAAKTELQAPCRLGLGRS